MAQLITIFWRDIPAQLIGRQGRNKIKKVLPPRFAAAIDRAAMRAGKGSSEAYMAEWHRTTEPVTGDVEAAVDGRAKELESRFSDEILLAMIRRKGLAENPAGEEETS